MPLYEYRCESSPCAERFEEFRPVGSEPPACPKCGERSARVFTAPNLEWQPSNVMWHRLPNKFDGPGRGTYADD